MTNHDIVTITLAIVASCSTIVSILYTIKHRGSAKQLSGIMCSLGQLSVAVISWLHFYSTDVIEHGSLYLPIAVILVLTSNLANEIASW